MIRVLLVDDDEDIRTSVAAYLERFAMVVQAAPDGREMRQILGRDAVDVIVLDLMLPDDSGLVLCQWLRARHIATPIIMLTALGDAGSRIVGLETGADDYLGKPFEPRELVARIHALVRRSSPSTGPDGRASAVSFQGWRFDRLLHQLVSPEQVVVALSAAEFRLLSAFVDRPRRMLTRDDLLTLTRAPGTEVNDRSIDLAVSRLRQKLGDPPRAPRLIHTVRGEGYLFDAEVGP